MSCDCNTLVIGEAGVQGPQGLGGINGTNGTNGLNAFTTTSANFVQLSVGAPVTFSVVENRWIAVGQTVYISQAGFYTVSALGGSPFSSVTANLISTDGVSVGGTVTSGRQVSPSASAVYSAPLASLTVTTGGVSSLDGPVTINESGNNADFRVEGDGDTHLLFCDANGGTNGRVGVSINAPETTLHVDGSFKVGTAAAPADSVFTKGATFNSEQSGSGTDGDFLIKTKNVSDTFFVDASTDFVGIGTNTPSKLLDVDGAAEMNTLLVNPTGVAANPSFQVYGTNSTRPITVLSTNTPFNGVGIFKTTPTVELDVVGAATITGATILGSTLNVTGDISVDTNVLKVDTSNNRVGINKTSPAVALDVVGATALSSTLAVTGATTLSSTLDVTGDFSVDTNVLKVDTTNNRIGVNKTSPAVALDVVGAATVSGATILSSTLDVTAATTLDSTLDVTGDLIVSIDTLVVDTSTSRVGINKTTPAVELDVTGSVQATDYRVNTGSGAAKLTKFLFGTGSGTFVLNSGHNDNFGVTVTGAVVGDFVQVAYSSVPSTTPAKLTLFGYVSASDTVTVVVANTSNATVASQTYSVNILVTRAAAS